MEAKNEWINQPATTQCPESSIYYYFTEQGLRAGYTGQELRHSQLEHHGHNNLSPYSPPLAPAQSLDMHEVIQREIEREQVREHIIMSEITKRRILEAGLRREIMILERQLTRQRGSNDLLLGLPTVSLPMELPVMGTRAEGRSVEERLALSPDKGKSLNVRCESRGFETLPISRGTVDLRISEVKHVTEKAKEEKMVILLAKPDANTSGSKRKAVIPPIADTHKHPSDKKAKDDWSCALCQVTATSELTLNEHLQGKKHKMKEASINTQRPGKNYSIVPLPTTSSVSKDKVNLAADALSVKKTEDASQMRENLKSRSFIKKQEETITIVQKRGNPKKTKFQFWCETCQVGAMSQKVLKAHENGKKHAKLLNESAKNNQTGSCNQKKKIASSVSCAKQVSGGGKGIISEKVNGVLGEARLEDHKPLDVLDTGSHEPADESKVEVSKWEQALDEIKT